MFFQEVLQVEMYIHEFPPYSNQMCTTTDPPQNIISEEILQIGKLSPT